MPPRFQAIALTIIAFLYFAADIAGRCHTPLMPRDADDAIILLPLIFRRYFSRCRFMPLSFRAFRHSPVTR